MPHHAHATNGMAEPQSTVNAKYVELSTTKALGDNEKIAHLFDHNTDTPYFVQRLSERAYFIGGGFYAAAFYVGDKGVLLFDGPEGIPGENLLAGIAQVTDLPVTAITYSHNHADHIISAKAVIDAMRAAGREVRLISSVQTADKMERFKTSLPRPTETVSWPNGSFEFEGATFEFHGFVHACHCDDAGVWLLKDEKVAYVPDLMNGDQVSQAEILILYTLNNSPNISKHSHPSTVSARRKSTATTGKTSNSSATWTGSTTSGATVMSAPRRI